MKSTKTILTAALLAAMTITFGACNNDKEDTYCLNITDVKGIPYDENGAWNEVFDTKIGHIAFGDFITSHYANETKWEGQTYKSWWGFCPSCSTDNADYSKTGFAGTHEWSSITGGGALGKGSSYLVAYYNDYYNTEESPSCFITFGPTYRPQRAFITNNTYAYYAMKNGSGFNEAFDETDWMKVVFTGIRNKATTGIVESFLAKDGKIVNTWQEVNLMSLGTVDYVTMTVDSSDKGVPTYFCLDNYIVKP